MGVVHPGAPRPWLYLISERRARALRRCTHPQPLITTRRCTHPQLACEILINLRFSDLSPKGSVNARFRWRIIIGSVICGHIYAVCYRIKQRNNASLLTSLTQAPTFPAYYTTN